MTTTLIITLIFAAGTIFGIAVRDRLVARAIRRNGVLYIDSDTRVTGRVEHKVGHHWVGVLALLMLLISSAHAQGTLTCGEGLTLQHGGCVPNDLINYVEPLPNFIIAGAAQFESDLTVKEVIEILVDYDVRHGDQQPFFRPSYGATDPYGRVIWIFNNASHAERRCTVIHELIHARDISVPEDQVRAEEDRQCKNLFSR